MLLSNRKPTATGVIVLQGRPLKGGNPNNRLNPFAWVDMAMSEGATFLHAKDHPILGRIAVGLDQLPYVEYTQE